MNFSNNDNNDNNIEVYKYKCVLYGDTVHKVDRVEFTGYCVENYLPKADSVLPKADSVLLKAHFDITINSNTLIGKVTYTLPVHNVDDVDDVDDYGEGISEIEKVLINKNWIDDCYKLYLEDIQVKSKKINLINSKPATTSIYCMFDKTFNDAWDKYKLGYYATAAILFEKCLSLYIGNINSHMLAYNIACCHAKMNIEFYVIQWLTKAHEMGYNDWERISEDILRYKDNEKIIELIKKMKEKFPGRDALISSLNELLNQNMTPLQFFDNMYKSTDQLSEWL